LRLGDCNRFGAWENVKSFVGLWVSNVEHELDSEANVEREIRLWERRRFVFRQ
jgi:hypothetical protein